MQARRHIVRSRDGVLVAVATLSPGVVLLDLDLGRDPDGTPIDGISLIDGLCRSGWRVLALSGTSDEARLGQALVAGALAGIPKSAALPVLVAAVRRAAQGVEVMHAERRRRLVEAHLREQDRGRTLGRLLEKLSERERAVLDRLAQGRRAQSIAEEFVVSVTTVRTQIRAILGKLEVGSQLEAVTLLYEFERAGRARS
jgi:DNA-binding NarL/FixJ family response regulator